MTGNAGTHDTSSTLWSTVRVAPKGGAGRDAGERAATPTEPQHESMTREQVVDQIMSMNPSASSGFLSQFEPDELGMYLRHLLSAQEPRGRTSRWARPDDAPSIMTSRRQY